MVETSSFSSAAIRPEPSQELGLGRFEGGKSGNGACAYRTKHPDSEDRPQRDLHIQNLIHAGDNSPKVNQIETSCSRPEIFTLVALYDFQTRLDQRPKLPDLDVRVPARCMEFTENRYCLKDTK